MEAVGNQLVIKEEVVSDEESRATTPMQTAGDLLRFLNLIPSSQLPVVISPARIHGSKVPQIIVHSQMPREARIVDVPSSSGVPQEVSPNVPSQMPGGMASEVRNIGAPSSSGVPEQMSPDVPSQTPGGMASEARNIGTPSSPGVSQQMSPDIFSPVRMPLHNEATNIGTVSSSDVRVAQQLLEQMSPSAGADCVAAPTAGRMQEGGDAESSSHAEPGGEGSCSSGGPGMLSPGSGDEVNMTARTNEKADKSSDEVSRLLEQAARLVGITSPCAVKVTRLTGITDHTDRRRVEPIEDAYSQPRDDAHPHGNAEDAHPQGNAEDGAAESDNGSDQTEVYFRDRSDPDWEEHLEEHWDEIVNDMDDPDEYTEEQRKRCRKKDHSSKRMLSYSDSYVGFILQNHGANTDTEDTEGQGDEVARTEPLSKGDGRHVMQEENRSKQLPRLKISKKKAPPTARRQKDSWEARTVGDQTDDNPGTSTNSVPYDFPGDNPSTDSLDPGASTSKDPPHPQTSSSSSPLGREMSPRRMLVSVAGGSSVNHSFNHGESMSDDPAHSRASTSNSPLLQDRSSRQMSDSDAGGSNISPSCSHERSPRQIPDSGVGGSNGSSNVLERIASTLDHMAQSMERMESTMKTLLQELSSRNTWQSHPGPDVMQTSARDVSGPLPETRQHEEEEVPEVMDEQDAVNGISQNDVNSILQEGTDSGEDEGNGSKQDGVIGIGQNDENGSVQDERTDSRQNEGSGSGEDEVNDIGQDEVNGSAQDEVNGTTQDEVNGTTQDEVNGVATHPTGNQEGEEMQGSKTNTDEEEMNIGEAVKKRLRVRVENMTELRIQESKNTKSKDSEHSGENNRLQGELKRLGNVGRLTGPKRARIQKSSNEGQPSADSNQTEEYNRLRGGLKRKLGNVGKFTSPKRVRFQNIPTEGQQAAMVRSPNGVSKPGKESGATVNPVIVDDKGVRSDATVVEDSVADKSRVKKIRLSQAVIKEVKDQAHSVTSFTNILLRKLVDKETLMMSTCSGKQRTDLSSPRPYTHVIDPNIIDYIMDVTYIAYNIASAKRLLWAKKCKAAISRMCLLMLRKKQSKEQVDSSAEGGKGKRPSKRVMLTGSSGTERDKGKSPSKGHMVRRSPLTQIDKGQGSSKGAKVKGSPRHPAKATQSKPSEKRKISVSPAQIEEAKTKAKYIGHFSWLVLRKLVEASTLRLSHTTGIISQRSQRLNVKPIDPDILAYVLKVTYETYGIAPDEQSEVKRQVFVTINAFCRYLFNNDRRQERMKKRLTSKSKTNGGASGGKVRVQKKLANKAKSRKDKEGKVKGRKLEARKTDSPASVSKVQKKAKRKPSKKHAKENMPLFEDGILELKAKSADAKSFTRRLLRKLIDDDTLMKSNCSGNFGSLCKRPVKGPIDPNILEYVLTTTCEVYSISSDDREKSISQLKTSINDMCRSLYHHGQRKHLSS